MVRASLPCTYPQPIHTFKTNPPPLFGAVEKRHAKLSSNNIHELERKPAYVVAPRWQPPTIDIPNSKERANQLQNQYLVKKNCLYK